MLLLAIQYIKAITVYLQTLFMICLAGNDLYGDCDSFSAGISPLHCEPCSCVIDGVLHKRCERRFSFVPSGSNPLSRLATSQSNADALPQPALVVSLALSHTGPLPCCRAALQSTYSSQLVARHLFTSVFCIAALFCLWKAKYATASSASDRATCLHVRNALRRAN